MRRCRGATYACIMHVTELHRYAVKGLSGDVLSLVDLQSGRFPNDRKYALLKADRRWDEGKWLHKENFLCAFTAPKLLASLESSFDDGKMLLSVRHRATQEPLLEPVAMNTESGRHALAEFLSKKSGEKVICLASDTFQFGNTSSGVKQRKDSRTVHIVNQNTVDLLANKIGVPLTASRFRPNIVIQGPHAWEEFEWIGKTLQGKGGLRLKVLSKTVRCKGVSVDPLDIDRVLDIPSLLVEHFPEHGPYLGVYAAVESTGSLALGDDLTLLN